MNLRGLQDLVEDIQVLKRIIDNDFGGMNSFREVLQRMKEFDQIIVSMGGAKKVKRLFEEWEARR